MSSPSTVTVLIPTRNEETDIERCLRAVLAQDYPHERMEIVLIDGGSTDRTVEVARRILEAGDVEWRIVNNPTGTTPSNLNAGLSVARGEILCRVDARSLVPTAYVRLCEEVLTAHPERAVTGGAQVAVVIDGESILSAAIARALNNKYAMGGSRYRSRAESGSTETVYLGAFRTNDLRSIGGWDEYFETNQDFELNSRMRRQGTVWYDARLRVGYLPRKTLADLWWQYYRFGRWKVRYWRRTDELPQRRQVLPLAGFALALVTLWHTRSLLSVGRVLVLAFSITQAVDAAGGSGPSPMRVRFIAGVVETIVVTAWVCGVYREALWGQP